MGMRGGGEKKKKKKRTGLVSLLRDSAKGQHYASICLSTSISVQKGRNCSRDRAGSSCSVCKAAAKREPAAKNRHGRMCPTCDQALCGSFQGDLSCCERERLTQDKNIQPDRSAYNCVLQQKGMQVAIFSGGTSVGSSELSRAGWPPAPISSVVAAGVDPPFW